MLFIQPNLSIRNIIFRIRSRFKCFPLLFRAIVLVYTLRGVFFFIAGFKLNVTVAAFLFYAGRHEKLQGNMLETKMDNELKPLISPQYEKDSSFAAGHVHKNYFSRLTSFLKSFCTLKLLAVCLWNFTYVYGLYGYVMYFPLYAEELLLTKFQVATLVSIFGKIVMGVLAGLPWVSRYTLTSVNLIIVAFLTILLPSILVSGPVYYLCMCHSSGECSARGQRNFRSFLRIQDVLPVWDPLPVG